MLRDIFGGKGQCGTEWRRQHKEELYDLYHTPNVIRIINSGVILAEQVASACDGSRKQDFGAVTRWKVPLGKPRCRWKDNWCGGMDWIDLAQDRDR